MGTTGSLIGPHGCPLHNHQVLKSFFAAALLLSSAWWGHAARGAETSALLSAARSITASESKHHVDVLAADSFEGREGGSRGGRAAGGYLATEFQKLGLKGAGDDGSYFQSFPGSHRNLLGWIEGSDPELKKQYVVVGAHYDHVGYGSRSNSYGPTGYIHNGADDNASGVAGLIEIAQAFSSLPQPPKRSVVFALWDGEEKGLLGSRHWINHPTVPLRSIALYINLDMIGRLRKSQVELHGTRTAAGLRKLISQQNSETALVLDFRWEMRDDSDHYPFYEHGVPSIMFHTGLHENYHRPSDDAHLVSHEGIERVARLTFGVAHEAANRQAKLVFRQESRRDDDAARRAFERTLAPLPPRFGVAWKEPKAGERGVELTQVTGDMPGAKAGLRAGDRIVRLGTKEITSGEDLRLAVLAAPADVEVAFVRSGQTEPQTARLALAGSPVRLGIAWRDDPAEPGSVMLTQVVPGSPSQRAGLRERDRIYEVAGQTFADGREFLKLVTAHEGPLELTAERVGVLHRLRVELPPPVGAR